MAIDNADVIDGIAIDEESNELILLLQEQMSQYGIKIRAHIGKENYENSILFK